jgi:hypothetical protein
MLAGKCPISDATFVYFARCLRHKLVKSSDLRLGLLLCSVGLALQLLALGLSLALELLGFGLSFLGVNTDGLGGGVLGLDCRELG